MHREVKVAADLRELRNFGTPMFPCSGIHEDIGNFINSTAIWHWHKEVEISYCMKGMAQVGYGKSTVYLKEGDGIFINSNVLHTLRAWNGSELIVDAFIADADVIAGDHQSIFEQKYVKPVVSCRQLEAVVFLKSEVLWQKEFSSYIRAAYESLSDPDFGSELRVREYFSRAWVLLAENNRELLQTEDQSQGLDEERVKRMLAFVQLNYAEPISVAEIAAAADVSETECYRCFRRFIHMSPVEFLVNFRLRRAAGMLMETERSVTEICSQCGFNSPSYFGKKFREQFLCSPRDYRHKRACG